MKRGWYGESRRHSLASRGIKTTIDKPMERIIGGRADGKPDRKYDSEQLKAGTKVESEHTKDPRIAKEIAKDHLEEHPDYYKELKKMEEKLTKEENATLLPKDAYVGDKLLEQKQLLLIKSGVPIGNWQRIVDRDEYIVWGLPKKTMHNPHDVVIRTETSPNGKRQWVTFVDMGRDGGTSVLNRGGSMGENLLVAKDYMMARRKSK